MRFESSLFEDGHHATVDRRRTGPAKSGVKGYIENACVIRNRFFRVNAGNRVLMLGQSCLSGRATFRRDMISMMLCKPYSQRFHDSLTYRLTGPKVSGVGNSSGRGSRSVIKMQ